MAARTREPMGSVSNGFRKSDMIAERVASVHSEEAGLQGFKMLNWKVRYAKIIARNRELLDPSMSVLEVGCGPFGIATFLDRPVTGVEPGAVEPMVEGLTIKQASVNDLPYADGVFDFVVCVDVLEHLAPEARIPAIVEMLRVARRRLIFSCPTKYFGELGEYELASWFDQRSGAAPNWLQEHLMHGLPDAADLIQAVAALGLPFEVFGNEGMLQHFASILLDYEFSLTQGLLPYHNGKTVFEAPIQASDWDLFYSYAFIVAKENASLKPIKQSTALRVPDAGAAIYAVCHDRALMPPCGNVTPLFAGPAAVKAGAHEFTDRPGSEPGLDNSRWSELSGIYRIWKDGPCSSVVGFCHYRRFFDFSGSSAGMDRSVINFADAADYQANFYSQDHLRLCEEDIVYLPRPVKLEESPFQHYATVHQANDLCLVISLISQQAPELLPHLGNLLHGNSFYAWNMFAMKWQLFDELCHTWFSILRLFEAHVAPGRANSYQNRDISFLAERLFDVWIRYAVERYRLCIEEVPIYFVTPCAE